MLPKLPSMNFTLAFGYNCNKKVKGDKFYLYFCNKLQIQIVTNSE